MAYSVHIDCPGSPRVEVLEAALEAVVAANTQWYLDQLELGLEPPCCCECAGIRYRPDPPGTEARLMGAPQAIDAGVASCQTAAALVAGRGRALAMLEGMTYDQARARFRVELEDGYHPQQRPGEPYWHAYYVTPTGRIDPIAKMERA